MKKKRKSKTLKTELTDINIQEDLVEEFVDDVPLEALSSNK